LGVFGPLGWRGDGAPARRARPQRIDRLDDDDIRRRETARQPAFQHGAAHLAATDEEKIAHGPPAFETRRAFLAEGGGAFLAVLAAGDALELVALGHEDLGRTARQGLKSEEHTSELHSHSDLVC